MTGGQETTTNLIGNGLLALMQNPESCRGFAAIPRCSGGGRGVARYESPIQYTSVSLQKIWNWEES